jgi:hypothetical protein
MLKTVNGPRSGASRGYLPSHNANALPVRQATKPGHVAGKAEKYAANDAPV